MCEVVVVAACDVTPELWDDFSKVVDLTEDLTGKNITPAAESRPPYVLLYSRRQVDFSRTGDLRDVLKAEFSDSTYAQMHAFIDTALKDSKRTETVFFMVLDEKSAQNRKVVFTNKNWRHSYLDDEDWEAVSDIEADDRVWRKHRISFEKACFFWLVFGSKPGNEGEELLENIIRKTADGL